jgi:hypothetical protein
MTYATPSLTVPRSRANVSDINDTAVGAESKTIHDEFQRCVVHFFAPYSTQWSNPLARFLTLKLRWEAETGFLSSITDIVMHPAYQQIIGMGPAAVPLILSEMKKLRGHWFWALKSITGEDPIMPEHRGNLKKMTDDWLRWGKEQGYLK